MIPFKCTQVSLVSSDDQGWHHSPHPSPHDPCHHQPRLHKVRADQPMSTASTDLSLPRILLMLTEQCCGAPLLTYFAHLCSQLVCADISMHNCINFTSFSGCDSLWHSVGSILLWRLPLLQANVILSSTACLCADRTMLCCQTNATHCFIIATISMQVRHFDHEDFH